MEENGGNIKLHNGPVIKRLLKHFQRENCKPAVPSLSAGLELSKNAEDVLTDPIPYRDLIGALLHFSNTVRSDICYVLNYLPRFTHNPTTAFYNLAKHVLRWIQITKFLGLWFHLGGEVCIRLYFGLDLGQKITVSKTCLQEFILCAGGMLSWRLKQHSVVARSSKEANFISLALCVRKEL